MNPYLALLLIGVFFSFSSIGFSDDCAEFDFRIIPVKGEKLKGTLPTRSADECLQTAKTTQLGSFCKKNLGVSYEISCSPSMNYFCRNNRSYAHESGTCAGQQKPPSGSCENGFWKLNSCTKDCPSKNCVRQDGCGKKWFCK